jgi:hypothetical protein
MIDSISINNQTTTYEYEYRPPADPALRIQNPPTHHTHTHDSFKRKRERKRKRGGGLVYALFDEREAGVGNPKAQRKENKKKSCKNE